jgi:2',3'-cyclic-nucleotide 2'-phosphodiesterase (5'-nucleotidase family)
MQALGKDVFLVDYGDVVDGTGISNVAEDHCQHLLPLYGQVPFDALNCGNHELYDNSTME